MQAIRLPFKAFRVVFSLQNIIIPEVFMDILMYLINEIVISPPKYFWQDKWTKLIQMQRPMRADSATWEQINIYFYRLLLLLFVIVEAEDIVGD